MFLKNFFTCFLQSNSNVISGNLTFPSWKKSQIIGCDWDNCENYIISIVNYNQNQILLG